MKSLVRRMDGKDASSSASSGTNKAQVTLLLVVMRSQMRMIDATDDHRETLGKVRGRKAGTRQV